MTNKRYFKVEYDEEWYLFDSTTISEQLVKEQAEYGYGVFANSLSPSEICDRLNALHEENISLKESQDGKRRAILWWEHYKEKWMNAEKELRKLKEENEKLRKQCFELEKDYLIETSDISDKIYLRDEIKELKQRYGVGDE